MARIRTIKPEFFTSEDIVSMTPLARLLYIALWCEADKEGRLAWKPKTFKMRYLPGDSCNIEKICGELIEAGVVILYGDGLAFIPSFTKHQHVNPRESSSTLPEPTESLRVNSKSDASILDLHAQGGREGKGREGEGKEGKEGVGSAKRRTQLPSDFYPDEHGVTAVEKTGLSLAVELGKFGDHHLAKGSVMQDWQAAWRLWIGNATKFSPQPRASPNETPYARQQREKWETVTGRNRPAKPTEVLELPQ